MRWTPNIKRGLLGVVIFIAILVIPFKIYGANGRFDIDSIMFQILWDLSESSMSFQFLPRPNYLLPSLLICAPCILWLSKAPNLRVPALIGSTGLVVFVLTLILLAFLPSWAVFPWFFQCVLAYVPEFTDLVPFSGLTFTLMVLFPLIWRGLTYSQLQEEIVGRRVALSILTAIVLTAPWTIETFSWQGSDINLNYFEGFSLSALSWTMSASVSGNRWGQGTWFYFSMSSIYGILALMFLALPGIIFAWFVCRPPYNRNRIVSMLAAGTIHLLSISIVCNWINITSSHPGTWILTPFPTLIGGGLAIAGIYSCYQLIRRFSVSKDDKAIARESEYTNNV